MWRQGDIFIASSKIPGSVKPRSSLVLAEGEVTGHAHRVKDNGGVTVLVDPDGVMFLNIISDGAIVEHEEHGVVTLPRGTYKVWRQREYSPEEIRIVRD